MRTTCEPHFFSSSSSVALKMDLWKNLLRACSVLRCSSAAAALISGLHPLLLSEGGINEKSGGEREGVARRAATRMKFPNSQFKSDPIFVKKRVEKSVQAICCLPLPLETVSRCIRCIPPSLSKLDPWLTLMQSGIDALQTWVHASRASPPSSPLSPPPPPRML